MSHGVLSGRNPRNTVTKDEWAVERRVVGFWIHLLKIFFFFFLSATEDCRIILALKDN